jgi:hypothetical protein
MPNEIGWGQPFNEESGYGMAAVNGAAEGYGTVVINSYSGETNISSQDEDNRSTVTVLADEPNLYIDHDIMYLYFQLAEDVLFQSISYEIYIDDVFSQDGALTTDGITELIEAPLDGSYVVYLTIAMDTETSYTFTSNTLIVG